MTHKWLKWWKNYNFHHQFDLKQSIEFENNTLNSLKTNDNSDSELNKVIKQILSLKTINGNACKSKSFIDASWGWWQQAIYHGTLDVKPLNNTMKHMQKDRKLSLVKIISNIIKDFTMKAICYVMLCYVTWRMQFKIKHMDRFRCQEYRLPKHSKGDHFVFKNHQHLKHTKHTKVHTTKLKENTTN